MSRRTARFEKIILTPGKYLVAYNGSTRVEDEFTAERIAKMTETGQSMINNGLRIPIPFVHFDQNGHTPTPITISDAGTEVDPLTGNPAIWDSSINGGFAESFYQNDEGALVAVLQSFGDENDLNTPAGKIGTTCQETSIGLAKKFVDGKGNVYEDAPIHIAACIKAIEPNQTNFVLLEDDDVKKVSGDLSIVSMSSQLLTMATPDSSSSGYSNKNGDRSLEGDSKEKPEGTNITADIPTLLNLLRKLESPIDLPDDTTDDTLIDRLVIAVNQKLCDEESNSEVEPGEGDAKPQPPKNAQEKQGTITMSNPANPPVEPTKPNPENVLLMSMLANTHKAQLDLRIAALKKNKGIKDEYINKHITPLMGIDTTTMSIADFDLASSKVKSLAAAEAAIAMLEDMEVKTMSLGDALDYNPADGVEIGYSEGPAVSPEEAKALADFGSMVANGQYVQPAV